MSNLQHDRHRSSLRRASGPDLVSIDRLDKLVIMYQFGYPLGPTAERPFWPHLESRKSDLGQFGHARPNWPGLGPSQAPGQTDQPGLTPRPGLVKSDLTVVVPTDRPRTVTGHHRQDMHKSWPEQPGLARTVLTSEASLACRPCHSFSIPAPQGQE